MAIVHFEYINAKKAEYYLYAEVLTDVMPGSISGQREIALQFGSPVCCYWYRFLFNDALSLYISRLTEPHFISNSFPSQSLAVLFYFFSFSNNFGLISGTSFSYWASFLEDFFLILY